MTEVGIRILLLCRCRLFLSFFPHLLALLILHCSRIHPPSTHIFCYCFCILSVCLCVYARTLYAVLPLHLHDNLVLPMAIVFCIVYGSVLIQLNVGRGGVYHCFHQQQQQHPIHNSQFSRVPHHHRQHTIVLLIVVCHTLPVIEFFTTERYAYSFLSSLHKYTFIPYRGGRAYARTSQRPYSYLLLLPLIFTLNVSVVCFVFVPVPVRFVSFRWQNFSMCQNKSHIHCS